MRLASVVWLAPLLAGCGRIGFEARTDTTADAASPDGVPAVGFSFPVAYGDLTCARYEGRAYCWGNNANGQLGDGTTMNRGVPTEVSLPAGQLQRLTVGETHGCAIVDAKLGCWGDTGAGTLPSPTLITLADEARDVAAGKRFTCVVAGTTAMCWGDNGAGQLGDTTTMPRTEPTPITSVEPIVAVDAGDDHACALTGNQTALCWGHNDDGALGFGAFTPTTSPTPLTVTGGIATLPIIAGWHACTVRDGAAWCWGRNSEGELGDGTTLRSAVPQPVPGLDFVDRLATGGGPADLDATCAVRKQELWCWGAGTGGRLGNGSTAMSLVPIKVAGLPGAVVDVALGYAHTCALLADGDLWCWGRGTSGQLGNGAMADSLTPVRVEPPKPTGV